MGCNLKLKRFGGLDLLREALDAVSRHGMESVLGDGLGAELGCWMEACVARVTIHNAGEFNGFLKPMGLGWSVSPFGSRSVKLTMVTRSTPTTVKLYLYGSDDNVSYYPIITETAWATGVTQAAHGDSAKFDTLDRDKDGALTLAEFAAGYKMG